MAAKTQQAPQDNTGSSVLSQTPPSIFPTTPVLASVIALPEKPLIVYSAFACASATADSLDQLEVARRGILLRDKGNPLSESLLPCVNISKDVATLYVFALGSIGRMCKAHKLLQSLALESLTLTESSSFTPASIYPCSASCSIQVTPCERCLNTATATGASSSQLLPRVSLRLPLMLFLEAVRSRLIDDVAEASKLHPYGRSIARLKGGFLLGPVPFSSEWGSGWENHGPSRPLIHCNLQVHISFSTHSPSTARLVIHPVMRSTYYLPLHCSLPAPAGTPIVLLPYGVPAYYLNTYHGSCAALTAQFDDALVGLGAGEWKRAYGVHSQESNSINQDSPTFVVVWLAVQNKQGEDKGMPVIWPATLCVSYHVKSPSAHARTSLPYIPELPAQLQASPSPPTAAVPTTLSFTTAASPATDVPASATTSNFTAALPTGERERLSPSFQRRPSLLRSSSTSDSLRAFRGLSLHKKPYSRDVKKVASEVRGYVDSVVKERERERERIRKERQEQELAAARAKLASANPPSVDPLAPSSKPEPPVPPVEEAVNPVPELTILPAEADPGELEPYPTVESDHSVDSLFSPPDINVDLPSTEEETPPAQEDPVAEVPPVPDQVAPGPAEPAEIPPEPTTGAFVDPFSTFDTTWGHQSDDYMNIDYDMGFGSMNMDSIGRTHTGGAGAGGFEMDDDLDDFTEADFAYFNAPRSESGAAAPALLPGITLNLGPAPIGGLASMGSPPLVTMDGTLSGPGPPSANIVISPWTSHLGDTVTPRPSIDMHSFMDSLPPPELLPPSPTKTPSSHSAPATPSVQLEDACQILDRRSTIFDPIPFASSHRDIDGKYAVGKFALPSPPADVDRTEPIPINSATNSTFLPGWKYKYSAVTDPRIGVVRKLIGVKRKSLDQGSRVQRRAPSWELYREAEGWQSSSPPTAEVDSEESEEEPWMEEDEAAPAAVVPRPSTPPPLYLPLGPTLLRTHFHHAHLLPMCSPLRPPGMAVNNTPGNTAPISAPTPVSPAAVLGAASEKTKSLEAAAQVLVKEIVENPIWSEMWRANASLSLAPPSPPGKIWQADARYIKHLVGSDSDSNIQIMFSEGSSEASSATSLQPLESPMLVVGKGDTVIQMSPTSLRFWEKLGLSPRAGQKDVTAFVFFEGTDDDRDAGIEDWLSRVAAAYSAKNFGAHAAGVSSHATKPGLVPTRFDTLRKTLMSFVSTIPTQNPHIVFYIATPTHIISSTNTTLRTILSAVRRFYKAHPGGDVLVHLVPESLIYGTHTNPADGLGGLDIFVCSVYDRILQPVTRAMSRKFFNLSAPLVGYFQAPSYAILPSHTTKLPYPKVTYSLESSTSSLDVMHRHILLHLGYEISACGRWVLAACVDAEGEAHELKAWLTPDDDVEEFVVSQVWTFVHEFSRRANIEWRIVISKLGLMTHSELDAWVSHLDSVVSMSSDVPPMHVTLLAIDQEHPWTFLSPQEGSNFDIFKRTPIPSPQMLTSKSSRHTHTTFSDVTCATYSFTPSQDTTLYPAYYVDRSTKCSPSNKAPGSSESPFVPDLEDEESPNTSAFVQTPSTELVRAPGWCTMICAPSTADYASLSCMRVFQLHVARSLRSTYGTPSITQSSRSSQSQPEGHHDAPAAPQELMKDIVRNFHELAVLSRTRWKLRADPALPFHLAALEVMRAALSGGTVDP